MADADLQENAQNPPRSGRTPRCIILAPTRELAKQVEREFQDSSPSLVVGCYYGGVDIGQQIRQLRAGVDVAVGTPGRFIDLINRGNLNLGLVRIQYSGHIHTAISMLSC